MARTQATEHQPTLSAIGIAGFKAFDRFRNVDLSFLTVFAGNNSSGKSSVLQVPLLLKQTMESGFDPGPLLLDGPSVRFHKVTELISRHSSIKNKGRIRFSFTTGDGDQLDLGLEHDETEGVIIRSLRHRSDGVLTELRPNMRPDTIRRALPEGMAKIEKSVAESHTEDSTPRETFWRVDRDRWALRAVLYIKGPGGAHFPIWGASPADQILSILKSLIHLPGLRGNPERLYPLTARSSVFPGTFEAYAASVLLRWQNSDDVDKIKRLEDATNRIGIASGVKAARLDDTHVEVSVNLPGDPSDLDPLNIADVGLGVSQALPILVALYEAKIGQVVIIEQPEIHLHPRGQYELGQLIAERAAQGVQILVETHSSMFLLGIQLAAARQRIAPHQVRLHWFKRDEVGEITIDSHELDPQGSYGDWAVDFDEESLRAEAELFNAISEEHHGSQDNS